MSIFSAQASAVATTANEAIGHQRRDGITTALLVLTSTTLSGPLGDLRRDEAWHVMLRSLHRQMRIAGISVDYRLLTHREAS